MSTSKTGNKINSTNFNLAEFLLETNVNATVKTKTAFYTDEGNFTYEEIACLSKKFSHYLDLIEVRAEERVAVLLPDCIDFVMGFLGSIWGGRIAVLINESASIEEIIYMINDCGARTIMTNKRWKDKLSNIELPKLINWILSDSDGLLRNKILAFKESPPSLTHRDSSAFWVYTSGSTGKPKGVMHAHYNPIVACENYGKGTLKLNSADIIYSAARMSFSYGLGASLYMPMYFNASAVISDTIHAFGHIQNINKHNPTIFFGIPDTYANIYLLKDISTLNTSSLRICISAAEKLSKSLWESWQKDFGIQICEGIGTTESTHIFISNIPGECTPGSTGKEVPGYKIRLINDQGNDVLPGEIGNLEVVGDGFMIGYWNKINETRNIFYGKALRTGDRYKVDKDGNYYFIGRKDNLKRINGRWVSPIEIEDVLLQNPEILEAAVILHDKQLDNPLNLTAYISLKPKYNHSLAVKRIRKILRTKLPKYKIPKQIHVMDRLPRTATGKINRNKLLIEQSIH